MLNVLTVPVSSACAAIMLYLYPEFTVPVVITAGSWEYFHENPELSFKEFKTADRLEKELRDMGLNPKRITETGIIADIKGNGKTC